MPLSMIRASRALHLQVLQQPGAKIAARAGQNLKPSSLELGGSDAFIVLEDADLEHTMKWAIWGRMYNDGQTCVKNEEAAIALANNSDFGLGGSVFTKDIARGREVASRIETGMMFVNNLDWADADLPFGGVKSSGYGRELGDMGIQQFINKKLVRISSHGAPA